MRLEGPKKVPVEESRNAALIILGILSARMGIKGFLLSSHFIDGGVTGISMLLASVLGFPLACLIPLINLPFMSRGVRQMGWTSALRSTLAIGGLSLCLGLVQYPELTPDLLLTALFGGFFIGAGIGLAIGGGAVLDGTEIAELLISLNVFIFSAAAFFLGIDRALPATVFTSLASS